MNFNSLLDQPALNYINDDYSNPQTYSTIAECQNACISNTSCVQYIYFNNDYVLENGTKIVESQSCFLRESVDIVNGVNVRPEAEAWSVQSNEIS